MSDTIASPNVVNEAKGEIVDAIPFMVSMLRDAYRNAPTPEDKVVARVLLFRVEGTLGTIVKLIEKIEFRPILLDRARRVLDVADRPEYIKIVIRELGAARIQDREFDRDLDVLYREARVRLSVLEEGEIGVLDQQEAAAL